MIQEKQLSADLLKQKDQAIGNYSELESKYKILDDKFQKLKQAYPKVRQEHITLLREVSLSGT